MGTLLARSPVLKKAPHLRRAAKALLEWGAFILLFLIFALGLVAL
ncbi:MAG TPA: hypothetical protein VEB39_07935 [Sphingomicrobium sp.]|nr:hypothetical protein [Sphingomicrobium sp.]